MRTHPMTRLIARHLRNMGQEVRPDNIILQSVNEEDGFVTIKAIIDQSEYENGMIDQKPIVLKFRVAKKGTDE